MEDGDQVIVMTDSNVNLVVNKKGTFRHRLESISLHELLLYKHHHIESPATLFPGEMTIDGIFGTPALEVVREGYSKLMRISDHMLAWVGIQWESALVTYQMRQRPVARRIQCDDPISVSQYIQILEKMLDKANICSAILKLENDATVPWTDDIVEAYEEFDRIITRIMIHGEK